MQNQTLMQYFEWYLPHDGQHWTRLAENAPHLAHLGISHVWMPPAFKATNEKDVGYGVYDLFDLGEFNQKGTVRTKYGFKEDYLQAIQALKEQGIQPMADVVLNHKAAADNREAFQVIEVDPVDRTVELGEPFTINGWTSFTFDGRQDTYNGFHWHWYHFTGTDYDAKRGQALESTVEEWFKPAAYALILLRQDGLPCVFYGDYYGISGQYAQEDFKEILDRLLAIRKDLAYGEQNDYFDHANCIGWVRSGAENQSPIAVLISNDQENSKSMFVGQEWTNQTFVDLLGNHQGQVTIDEEGYGQFPVSARSVSVWAVNTI